jgi:two-component system, sensor histidine kinase SagS
VPVILMTGFGWDPTHSIVKARQEGLQTVLYKPFRADRLMDAVEQALRTTPPARPGSPGQQETTHSSGPAAPGPAPSSAPCPPPDPPPPSPVTDHEPTDFPTIEASNHEP